ncbi:MAG: hypothetical protein JWN48_3611 [Myxococcaceae bacterium]|nr:hypothetical protein [Myxococcaceae bacterium]
MAQRYRLTLCMTLWGLAALGEGCVLEALALGGPHGRGWRPESSAAQQAPTYDCRRNLFLYGSTCTPRPMPPPKRAPMLLAARGQPTYTLRDGTLQTRMNIGGGTLRVRGQPSTHPTLALLELRSTSRLAAAPCGARLFRDGRELTVHESVRKTDAEMLIAVEVTDLEQLQDSVRFAVQACGLDFELDEAARATLSGFAARFVEERSKLSLTLATPTQVAAE